LNGFLEFPFSFPIDTAAIDTAVRAFANRYKDFFDAVTAGLRGMVNAIYWVLDIVPWWAILIVVFLLGWRATKKIRKGALYAALLFLVGAFGMWDLMNETLSIVIASVIISLILGFILGVAIARSPRAERIVRPILDTMQTMPVFVYLIPALLFFGLGKAPGVVATTIYAVVPMIRLTCHGLQQVDKEVVEAAQAFGATYFQTLWKVQIPQAMPTIMTGVNQTLMMAMSMVVTCSMIGATGLGMEVYISVNRTLMGNGLISGTAVVIIAVILDRLTQSVGKKDLGR